jgi:DnaJ-class molecular chaperone
MRKHEITSIVIRCRECDGHGAQGAKPCQKCGGRGVIVKPYPKG